MSRLRPAKRGRPPASLNVPPLVVPEHDWEVLPSLEPDSPAEREADHLLFGPSRKAEERVKKDNTSSRLRLALLGSRDGRADIDNQVIDSLMGGLAKMLVDIPVHVVVGPTGLLTLMHEWNSAHPPRLQLRGGEYRFSRG